MTGTIPVPLYLLRGSQLVGWHDMQRALDYSYADGILREGMSVAINTEKMLAVEDNPEVRALIEATELKYVDGISVTRPLRKKHPQAQVSRVTGTDFWEALMQRAGVEGTPVFLVGGRYGVLTQTESRLRQCWQVNIIGSQDGYFTPEQRQALSERIRDGGAKVITVAMGSLRQEVFMCDCRRLYPRALYMGVSDIYDIFAGHVHRAPRFWQDLGLEWSYRLLLQSSRTRGQFRLLRYLRWHYTGKLRYSIATRRVYIHILCNLFTRLILYLPLP